MNYKSQTININFIFILHYYIISSVALNVFRFAQLISKNDRPKPPKSGYQNADVSRKGGCDFWGLKAPYQPKLRSVEIVPSKNNVEPLEEVDFNLLFLKNVLCKTAQGHFIERHVQVEQLPAETDTFTPSKFNFAYNKNLQARSHETMNHAKESHLFNEPWNVQSKEFARAVTLLGK